MHTHPNARTHAACGPTRMHAHARTHACTHTRTHARTQTELNLAKLNLTAADALLLCADFEFGRNCDALKTVLLQDNRLGENINDNVDEDGDGKLDGKLDSSGLHQMAKVIKRKQAMLERLDLRGNLIADDVAEALAEVAWNHPTIITYSGIDLCGQMRKGIAKPARSSQQLEWEAKLKSLDLNNKQQVTGDERGLGPHEVHTIAFLIKARGDASGVGIELLDLSGNAVLDANIERQQKRGRQNPHHTVKTVGHTYTV